MTDKKFKIQKSKIPYNFLSKYKQKEGTIGEEYLFCLRDCLSNKSFKLKEQVIFIPNFKTESVCGIPVHSLSTGL